VTSPVEVSASGVDNLSDRERQVLGMAAAGYLDKQIGQELGVSLNTLRTYWSRIRGKMGEAPRAALAAVYTANETQSPELDASPEISHGTWIIDVRAQTMTASDAINEAHGLEKGVEHPLSTYLQRIHPEDREMALDVLKRVTDGEVDHAHVVYRRVLSTGIDLVSLSVRSLRSRSGEVVKVIGSRAESADCRPGRDRRVRVGSWTREIPSGEFWISDELRDILQIRPDEEIRSALLTRTGPEYYEQSVNIVEKAIARGEEWVYNEGELHLPDGSRLWARVTIHMLNLGEGKYRVVASLATFN
jgi:DNA-binding CsgD family transcriptional regulator